MTITKTFTLTLTTALTLTALSAGLTHALPSTQIETASASNISVNNFVPLFAKANNAPSIILVRGGPGAGGAGYSGGVDGPILGVAKRSRTASKPGSTSRPQYFLKWNEGCTGSRKASQCKVDQ